jgi:integrase/recombinase XerD
MTVKAILKGMIDQNGHQPIQIRIGQGQRRTYFPTRIKVHPDLFIDGKISPKHPKAKEWNERIRVLIIQCQAESLEKKVKKINFYTYLSQVIPTLERKKESLRQYQSQITKLKEYNPSFNVDEINKDFLNGYKTFLKKKGNDVNTVWSSFKFLRKFVKMAKADGYLNRNPFENYEFPKYIDPDKEHLTEEEVLRIDKLLREGVGANLMEAGTWFLIACYTGFRIADIKAFNPKIIVGDRLILKTQKTKEKIGLPISPRLREYFERVNYKKLSMHQNTYNELIKIIAAAADINKRVSTHTARHTTAMLLANAGVSQEVTAKILGHKDLRSTATYYKITNKRIDSEMLKIH